MQNNNPFNANFYGYNELAYNENSVITKPFCKFLNKNLFFYNELDKKNYEFF